MKATLLGTMSNQAQVPVEPLELTALLVSLEMVG